MNPTCIQLLAKDGLLPISKLILKLDKINQIWTTNDEQGPYQREGIRFYMTSYVKMTGENPEVRSDKRKPREDGQNHRYHRYHRYQRYHIFHRYHINHRYQYIIEIVDIIDIIDFIDIMDIMDIIDIMDFRDIMDLIDIMDP